MAEIAEQSVEQCFEEALQHSVSRSWLCTSAVTGCVETDLQMGVVNGDAILMHVTQLRLACGTSVVC